MENRRISSYVIIAYDATKDRTRDELKLTVDNLRMRGDILRAGYRLLVLGVLHLVPFPMGYQLKACPDSFGGTSQRAMQEEVTKKVDTYVSMLQECENEGVTIEVKVTAGYPVRQVILQEVQACNAAWVVLDRHLQRDRGFYSKQIPCKVALIENGLSVRVLKSHATDEKCFMEHKFFYSMTNTIPISHYQGSESISQSPLSLGRCLSFSMSSFDNTDTAMNIKSSSSTRGPQEHNPSLDFVYHKQEKPGASVKAVFKHTTASQVVQKEDKCIDIQKSSEAPVLCYTCGVRTELNVMGHTNFSYSEIQLATNNFSDENLIGEGGYGHVYKGRLRNGQLIAAKVHKEASTQGFAEFHSELYILSFARHKNIVMLLGYSCKERVNILVYEYICNKSLHWHLFDSSAEVLEWHKRFAIAIGTAKGLRFLHEECRGGPIIHRDMRPSNILITHDFVPMLGDFGLAKWKTGDDSSKTRILGTLGYLAPEYAEDGIVSVRTDVYSYGIVLLQLISGRKVVDPKKEDEEQCLRQWAEPRIKALELRELVDARLGDSYDRYELNLMAKTAYFCVQRNPEMRPSMGEVVHLLEGESDHFHQFRQQVLPAYNE